MNDRIADFVRSCPECQNNKTVRHQPYGLSSPLELPYTLWQSIAMDFITELPLSEGWDQLRVVIDRFTKMAHFLPLDKEKKMAADLAVGFAREVWKYHGLPTDIVSNHDSRFTSVTWQEFLWLSGIRPRMSTAFHPQIDGQRERLNETIEAYLRAFVGHDSQDNWVSLLPMAEFAYNNSVTMGNGMSLFYANYGFHPMSSDPAASGPLNPASILYAYWMHAVHKASAERLEAAHERMRRYTDPQRAEPPKYKVGDLEYSTGATSECAGRPGNWTTRIMVPSRWRKSSRPSPFDSPFPGSGRFTMSSMYHYSNPIGSANTGRRRTPQKYSERPTTSNRMRSTMLMRSLGAPRRGAASCTSSNGSTTQTGRTGRRSHTTTFR